MIYTGSRVFNGIGLELGWFLGSGDDHVADGNKSLTLGRGRSASSDFSWNSSGTAVSCRFGSSSAGGFSRDGAGFSSTVGEFFLPIIAGTFEMRVGAC